MHMKQSVMKLMPRKKLERKGERQKHCLVPTALKHTVEVEKLKK